MVSNVWGSVVPGPLGNREQRHKWLELDGTRGVDGSRGPSSGDYLAGVQKRIACPWLCRDLHRATVEFGAWLAMVDCGRVRGWLGRLDLGKKEAEHIKKGLVEGRVWA